MQEGADMTEDQINSHVVAAMLGLDAAERAAASRAGWDSVEEWSLAWGGVVTAQRALSAAAGPNLAAQAASLEPLEAGDCAEYLRACVWALETIGPDADMPGLMVARAYVEDVAREVAAISAKESEPSGSGGSWRRLSAALLARGHRSCMGVPEPAGAADGAVHWAT
jgi:hypothetical protein